MKWQEFVMDEFLRIEDELGQVLKGLTVEDLNTQPAPDCNSIGWLAWHLTRSHDRNMSEVMGEEQLGLRKNGTPNLTAPLTPARPAWGIPRNRPILSSHRRRR